MVYPVARAPGGKPAAQEFIDFLREPAAAKVFRQYGFTVLD
ncbi:MAG: substrate-binding domain-containing protein [Candidatus Competibacteraceae bacterium]|nr:substrate-binding domain-containing protein [Candidatus Competibacteraceae bacterium]